MILEQFLNHFLVKFCIRVQCATIVVVERTVGVRGHFSLTSLGVEQNQPPTLRFDEIFNCNNQIQSQQVATKKEYGVNQIDFDK